MIHDTGTLIRAINGENIIEGRINADLTIGFTTMTVEALEAHGFAIETLAYPGNQLAVEAEPFIGQVVTFRDPYATEEDTEAGRFAASYIPGSVGADGEFVECSWVDAYGGGWSLDDINANDPEIVVVGVSAARSAR